MKPQDRHLKNRDVESRRFRRRAVTGFVLIVLSLLALGGRFFWLQVLHHDAFASRARSNRVHVHALGPPRGLIYDRNGKLLADNVPAFRLDVIPEQVDDLDRMLDRLSRIVALSDAELSAFHRSLKQHRAFEKVPLKMTLSEDQMDRFAVNRWRFPAVNIEPYLRRRYPAGAEFAHVLGYVGRIDAQEKADLDASRYKGTNYIGKSGIEKFYEDQLHGRPGFEVDEVNVDQRVVRVLRRQAPTPGQNLYLTLDSHLQKAAGKALHGRPGAVVAIDPRNGEVLAMVSQPSFDPNLFVDGISQRDYSALLDAPGKPLLHRALRGRYPPGSTIKPMLGLGGLVLGYRTPEDTVMSTGVYHLPGVSRGYRDAHRYGAGKVNMVEAIAESVNTYFYKLAHDMGIGAFSDWMGRFGFGEPTGIDLQGEVSGILPSRKWKRAHRSQPWYPGETVIAGIGQGYWQVTPLQLAHAVATLADSGVPHRPHLLRKVGRSEKSAQVVPARAYAGDAVADDPDALATIRKGMLGVVYGGPGSTANGLGDGFPYKIAGKTGTTERYSRTDDSREIVHDTDILAKRHQALFVAYTPVKDPRIAVAVIVEHGAWGGSTAAPIARRVLDAWVDEHGGPDDADDTAAGDS